MSRVTCSMKKKLYGNDSIEFSHTTVPAKAVSRLWASFERRNFLLSALAAEPDGTKVFCYQTFGCFRLSCACLRVLVTGKHRLITDFVDYSRFHVTAAFTKLNLSCFVCYLERTFPLHRKCRKRENKEET